MAHFDFDAVTPRTGTDSLKYDFAVERGRPANVLPLWVADMDFPAPPCVLDALRTRVEHGIFGYSETKEDYADAVTGWFSRRFGWEAKNEWLVKTPGVVFALAMAVRAFSNVGDSVLIQPPVYYPFFEVIRDNDRVVVENALVYQNGKYALDLTDFERKIVENKVKLFLLCSPHNPIGHVWSKDELQAMGQICQRYGVTVVSDEIHCDFAFTEAPHTIFLQACPEMAEHAIVCTAPSKSFNLAGLQVSNIFIPDATLRAAFRKEIDRSGYSQLNTLGLTACKAAYLGGDEWLDECKQYLRSNLDFVREYLAKDLPQIHLVEPNGTYFAWLDCSGLGLTKEQLDDLVVNRAGLWLDAGHIFGAHSEQFQRVVLACPRATLKQALDKLGTAVHSLNKE
jgi:cystathionine beta-lyase